MRSSFILKSMKDILLLMRIYKNVPGELNISKIINADFNNTTIKWCENPFDELYKIKIIQSIFSECIVTVRLRGPSTLINQSPKIKKINRETFEHKNKDLILDWSEKIDAQIEFEIERSKHGEDNAMVMEPPKTQLNNIDELILAACVSKYATHVLPGKMGCVMLNPFGAYNVWIDLHLSKCKTLSEFRENSSKIGSPPRQFDKDDGFTDYDRDTKSPDVAYMNAFFNVWKNKGYVGNLSDYFTEYSEYWDH